MKRMNKQLLSDFLNQVEKLENLDTYDDYRENGKQIINKCKTGGSVSKKEVNKITAQMRVILSKFTIDKEKA